ncbi:MAG: Sec-independent protein translocase protein TatB [Pseudomonadota bacterium]
MPDIGFLELIIIAVVALIVVGPKDLPVLFRKAGQFTGRMRGMAREFSRAMNDAADESGMREMSRDIRNLSNPKQMGMDAVNKAFDGIDPELYPEGWETRNLAETRIATEAARRAQIAARRAAREETAADAQADPEPAPAAKPGAAE